MKSDKEIIKILAEEIIDNYYETNNNDADRCRYCGCILNVRGRVEHKDSCAYLLAEKVLKEGCVCGGFKTLPVNDGHGSTKECPYCKEDNNTKEVEYTQLTDTHTICYKCNMIHRKDEECKTDKYCNHKVELKSFDSHGDITHVYRCEKCFQRFVPISSDMKLGDLYYIPRKSEVEEPLIVHNVMKYKGEYYLKQPCPILCTNCSLLNEGEGCLIYDSDEGEKCRFSNNYSWKSFKDIQITDELACMRKDIGDIYLTYDNKEGLILYSVRGSRLITSSHDDRDPIFNDPDYVRLATAEEIQKYLSK